MYTVTYKLKWYLSSVISACLKDNPGSWNHNFVSYFIGWNLTVSLSVAYYSSVIFSWSIKIQSDYTFVFLWFVLQKICQIKVQFPPRLLDPLCICWVLLKSLSFLMHKYIQMGHLHWDVLSEIFFIDTQSL